MKVAVYPGSFNPWHKGHEDILKKALKAFDYVVVVKMFNPEKICRDRDAIKAVEELNKKVKAISKDARATGDVGTLKEFLDQRFYIHGKKFEASGVVRGLRNGHDLQYEMNQQYWNEDVGVKIPFVYFVADRTLGHVSSSSIRMVDKLGLEHDYKS